MAQIQDDSPLRRVPATVDTRTILYLDGIRYSYEIACASFVRLNSELEAIATLPDADPSLVDRIVHVMLDAWVVIDSLHRLRELVQQVPGFKQKQPEVQVFLRGLESVEHLRHFVQHFRTEIDTFVARKMPLWGALSWTRVNPESGSPESHTIVPGTLFDEVAVPTCTFDSLNGRFVERVVLHAGVHRVDIADLFDRATVFLRWFASWCGEALGHGAHHGADAHVMFTVTPANRPFEAKTPPAE